MKQWKRLLSFVLAVSLVASMGIVLPEVQADSSPAFPTETTWDFAGADGWTLGDGFTVADGKLTWKSGLNSGTGAYNQNNGQIAKASDSASSNWLNYTISADITASYNNSQKVDSTATVNQHAMVGIAFYVSATDYVQVRVRPTTTENKYTVNIYENTTSPAVQSKTVEVGTLGDTLHDTAAFNLKVKYETNGTLTVYIDDTEVTSATVTTTTPGTPGLMAWCSASTATSQDTVTFDNVKVTPLAAPVITPEADYNGTLLGWSDGSEALGTDWTVSGTATAENGVLKATTADNFSAKVGSAVQHGYIEADVTLPAKSDFTATANKALGYLTATVGSNQVYTLRLFWQQTKNSTTLHDGTLYADLFINDSAADMTAQYGGAAQGTRVSFKLADANWGKTYTMRLARIGNFVDASLVDTETGATLKSWQYALNPAYSIVTGPMTFAFAADTKDTGCTVTFDDVVAASVEAYAVSAGELEMTVDSFNEIATGRDDSTIDSFYRTAYAPGETVTVNLKSADAWNLDSLGYTTASNPTGAKLVATENETVYTFVMPDEAVTLVGTSASGEITEPTYEMLFDQTVTPDANSTTGWRANATTVADKGICVKPATDTNGIINYYNTGVVSGWIKADITLPTISEDALKTNAANTGDIWYGLSMARGDGANIESSKCIDAAIWYQRNTGTTEATPKIGKSYLRIRFSGTGYDAANLLEISLPNTLWTTGATVSMEMRKVGNYILVKVSCDTIPEANQIACCTVNFDTFAGGKDGTWKFGLRADNPLLYTDWTKTQQVAAEAYFNNVEIGKILRTVSVSVDSTAAEYVSLPVVNEFKGTALARDAYEVGEVIALVVADGADISNLKYTVDDETEAKSITDPAAFEVPDAETKVTIVSQQDATDETLYTSEGKTTITTADGWSADMTYNTEKGGFNVANSYYKTKMTDGWMSVTLKLPTLDPATIKTNNAGGDGSSNPQYCLIMRSEDGTARFYVDIMLNRAVGDTTLRFDIKEGSYTASRYYATENVTNKELNAIWNADKPLTVTIRKVGNYYEAVFVQDGNVICTLGAAAELTAGSSYPMANPDTQWMFGVLPNNGKLWADSSKTTTIDITPYITKIEVGRINDTVAVTVDPEAQSQISLPSVNNLSSSTQTVERTAYQVGEKLELKLADGVNAANLKYTTEDNTDGVAITDAAAFAVPNEDAITLTTGEGGGSTEPEDLISATYNGGEYDATKWTATGSNAYVSEPFANGYIEAEFAISGTISNAANMFVRSPKTAGGALFGQEEEIMLRWTVVADSSQAGYTHKATSALVIRDYATPGYHLESANAIHGKAATVYLNIQEGAPAILKVKMEVVGNLLRIYVNGELHQEATFDPQYPIASQAGFFGYYGLSDSAKVTKATVQEYKTYTVTTPDSMIADETAHLIKPYSQYGASFGRTAYAAGETVTVTVKDPTGMDLASLRYVSVTNTDGTILTATGDPLVFTFVMPSENVALTFDEGEGLPIVPKPEGQILKENFDTVANGTTADKIFKDMDVKEGASNAKALDGALKLSNSFSMQTPEKYLHGYIQADITLEQPLDAMANATETVTKYGGNMSAKWGGFNSSNNEMRTRFMITRTPGAEKEYNVYLQLIVYARVGDNNYGGGPVIHQVELTDFAWGNTYNVKLSVIGNWLTVHLDGARVMAYSVPADSNIASYEGHFGVAHIGGGFSIAVDNLEIQSYKAYEVSLDSAMEGVLNTDIAPDLKSGKVARRTHYLENEFVKLHVSAPAGYGIDDATIKYTGATCGDVAITAKDSAILYGFRMPAEDVTVSASLTEAETQTNPINDTFDTESLMVDRGWGKEFKILDGKARAYGHTDSYLTGVAGADNWQSYTASAKITVLNTTGSSTAVASLCVKTSSTAAGYEFGMTFNAGATTGNLRLYDRANGKMLYTGEKELKTGVEYTLMLVVTGNRISGYLNGAWRFTVYVDDTVGGVGVRAQGVNVIYDDVKVTDIVAK